MVAVIALILVAVMACYYLIRKPDGNLGARQKAGLKVIPTSLCALLALYGTLRGGGLSAGFLCMGLVVCALADWLLEFAFFKGMAAFALGHVLYCIGYLLAGPFMIRSVIVFAVLFGIICVIYSKLKDHLENAPMYLAYAAVLCCMASLAASRQSFLMIGGFLFVISDCMIGIGQATGKDSRLYGILILATYYAAQFLIALSTLS